MQAALPAPGHLVIAGTVKGGTTSLFDYLSRHPDISPSAIKETEFFLPLRYGEPPRPVAEYAACFPHHAGQAWTMEATPGYLDGRRPVAEALRAAVPQARVVFVLRDPVERCISFLRFKQAMLELPADLDLADYIARCDAIPVAERTVRRNNRWWGVEGGHYARSLADWYAVFPDPQVRVVFFDDLVRAPHAVLADLCAWLGLPDVFAGTQFGVENKTRNFRLRWLQALAIRANRGLEAWLRRAPAVKAMLRSAYYAVNEGQRPDPVDATARAGLAARYAASNRELARLLRAHGVSGLPAWLQGEAHG